MAGDSIEVSSVALARGWSVAVRRQGGYDDVLAAGLARLLLWSDSGRLSTVGDEQGAWNLYLRTWRPGAHDRGSPEQRAQLRAKWGRNYGLAVAEVGR